jgi:hypothetical protein
VKQCFDTLAAIKLAGVLQCVISFQLNFVKCAGFPECSSEGLRCAFVLFLDLVTQKQFGGGEDIRVKAFPKCLALNLYSPKISACAHVLHQVWNFWK